MKFRHLAVIALFAAATGAAIWFGRPPKSAAPESGAAPPSGPAAAPATDAGTPAPGTSVKLSNGLTLDLDPQAELRTAIPDMIGILESGDYGRFVRRYMAPDELARMKDPGKADLLKANSANPQARTWFEPLLAALKSIRDARPTFDEKGETATYVPALNKAGEPNTRGADKMTFVRVNYLWYLKN